MQTISHKKGHGKTSTKRLASSFELAAEEERSTTVQTVPPSIVPALLSHVRPVQTSTEVGLLYVEADGDGYMPGTLPPRAYQLTGWAAAQEGLIQEGGGDVRQDDCFPIDPELEDWMITEAGKLERIN